MHPCMGDFPKFSHMLPQSADMLDTVRILSEPHVQNYTNYTPQQKYLEFHKNLDLAQLTNPLYDKFEVLNFPVCIGCVVYCIISSFNFQQDTQTMKFNIIYKMSKCSSKLYVSLI